ncbi:MAG: preprotein translocase subunit SecG [Thiogranum sp.]|nr:preprotein translocase subunit SecG [Thiogranum sp.]
MFTGLLIFQVLLGLTIIGLVLLQQGKGADMGAAFGAGSSGTVFGASGGGSFFTRTTGILAALFFINSILLSSPLVLDIERAPASVTERVPAPAAPETEDLPGIGEEFDLDGSMSSDLPEMPAAPPATESDLPE